MSIPHGTVILLSIESIILVSDAHDMDHVNLTWAPVENMTKDPDIKFPDMRLEDYSAGYCDGSYTIGEYIFASSC